MRERAVGEHSSEIDVKRKDAGEMMWGIAGAVWGLRARWSCPGGVLALVSGVRAIDVQGICSYISMRAVCLNPGRSNCCVHHHGEHVGLNERAVVGECVTRMIKPQPAGLCAVRKSAVDVLLGGDGERVGIDARGPGDKGESFDGMRVVVRAGGFSEPFHSEIDAVCKPRHIFVPAHAHAYTVANRGGDSTVYQRNPRMMCPCALPDAVVDLQCRREWSDERFDAGSDAIQLLQHRSVFEKECACLQIGVADFGDWRDEIGGVHGEPLVGDLSVCLVMKNCCASTYWSG